MTDLKPLFDAKGELVTSGLHPGVGNTQIPLWEKGTNVVFKDGSVKPGPPQSLIFTKASGLLGNGIRSIDNQGSAALAWGNRQHLYRGTAVPTTNNATRASTLINDMDSDVANWTEQNATITDDALAAPGGTGGCLRIAGLAASTLMGAWRALEAGPTDFTNRVFTFWVRLNAAAFAKGLHPGWGFRIWLYADATATTHYYEYRLPGAQITAGDSWFKIELDVNAETPDSENGVPDLTAIESIKIGIQGDLSLWGLSDYAYIDELEFAGYYTGTDLDRWSIVQYGQSVLATNGVDEVQYLADITTGLFVDLSEAGGDLPSSFRAQILHKLGPFIIAFNTDNDNTEARWCSEDNVLNWLPIAQNSARDINLRDMNSSIKCVVEFGNSLLVVGSTRAHLFQFIGPPFFFGAQKYIDGIGAVGKNALTEGGRMIYGFSPHGLYITDGTEKQYIDEPSMHSFIFESDNKYDKTRAELVCVWEDAIDDEIYFSYPTIDGSGFTVSFNPKLQVWSMHNYWRTAASPGELWDAPVLMAETGDIWIQSTGGAGSSFDVNPLGLSDKTSMSFGYGDPGHGHTPYGGQLDID